MLGLLIFFTYKTLQFNILQNRLKCNGLFELHQNSFFLLFFILFFFLQIFGVKKHFSIHLKIIWHCRLYQQNKNIHVDSWMNTETTILTTEYHKIHLCAPFYCLTNYTQMRRLCIWKLNVSEWVNSLCWLYSCRFQCSFSFDTVRLLKYCSHTLTCIRNTHSRAHILIK